MIPFPPWADRVGRYAGWIAIYIALGGLLGFALARHYGPSCLLCSGFQPKPNCMPELEMFGGIGSRCQISALNWFWFASIGLPRAPIQDVGMTIAIVRDEFSAPLDRDPANFFLFFASVLVQAAFGWLAIRHWWPRAPRVTLLVAVTIVLDITLYWETIVETL